MTGDQTKPGVSSTGDKGDKTVVVRVERTFLHPVLRPLELKDTLFVLNTLLFVPAGLFLVLAFGTVGRHYGDVRTRLRDPGGDYPVVRGPVVLFVSALDDATADGVRKRLERIVNH